MGPDVRESRARTTRGRFARESRRYAPYALANRVMTSGVSPSPTRPRTPDTLTIRSCGISNDIALHYRITRILLAIALRDSIAHTRLPPHHSAGHLREGGYAAGPSEV